MPLVVIHYPANRDYLVDVSPSIFDLKGAQGGGRPRAVLLAYVSVPLSKALL